MIDEGRLKILTEGAKYDVSCSSSGSRRRNTKDGLGNASFGGICHSFTQDGRCISLLKILMSNDCVFDCKYCPNRRSADVERATITPEEICELTLDFYRRNYIEGLFLSSAVLKNPDYTMELLIQTVTLLRKKYKFNGYIHLKGIPHADLRMTELAATLVDRMSYNLELPTSQSLKLLAPQKTKESILTPMRALTVQKEQFLLDRKIKTGRTYQNGTGKIHIPPGY
jgi:predicted DNA-binding helix-hairpin-helix protein